MAADDRGPGPGDHRPDERAGTPPPPAGSEDAPPPDDSEGGPPPAGSEGSLPPGGPAASPPAGAPRPAGGDATAPLHPRIPDDATRRMPPVPGDATAPLPPVPPGRPSPPDATSVMPGVDTGVGAWSARAEVPRYVPETTPEPMWRDPAPEPRRWWLPVLLGVVALLLLGALGYGAWLLVGGEDTPQPATPTAEPPARPTARPTVRPTTARPTTTAPRPSPTTVAPQRVQVPDVVGDHWREARERLGELGLSYQLEPVVTDEAAPEEVVRTRPGVGSTVAEGTVVTLVVAEAPAPTAPTDPQPSPTGEPT